MGLFGALNTAVTGLQAQSFALENISGNIANSQTTAFKRIDTSFEDLISDDVPSQQTATDVLASSRATNTTQGDIQTASTNTFMAINGDGFFVVKKPTSTSDSGPVFDGADDYTRRGDFQTDKNGYLVNGAGYYLEGIPIDPNTGNLTGSQPQILQFQDNFIAAQPTSEIDYHANLASYPLTTDHDTTVPGSELIDPALLASSSISADDSSNFLAQSISGGAITAYDASGNPVNLQIRWAKTDSASLGTGHSDTWNMFYETDSTATGTQAEWQNVGTSFAFDSTGQLNPAINSVSLTGVTVDGTALGNVTMQFGPNGLTQFADSSGGVQVNQATQDGYAAGQLQSISVNDKGIIEGLYSNGRTVDLAQVTLANFKGANFLKRLDGGAFEATQESGQATYDASGKVVGSSLENSNVDIADEFTKLIVTQQAYSANTRVISTSNQMVQDVLNMLR